MSSDSKFVDMQCTDPESSDVVPSSCGEALQKSSVVWQEELWKVRTDHRERVKALEESLRIECEDRLSLFQRQHEKDLERLTSCLEVSNLGCTRGRVDEMVYACACACACLRVCTHARTYKTRFDTSRAA